MVRFAATLLQRISPLGETRAMILRHKNYMAFGAIALACMANRGVCSVEAAPAGEGGGGGPVEQRDEYASCTIVVDHLVREPFAGRGDEFAIKVVYSNKDARQALVNQIGYFQHQGCPNLLLDENHFATVAAGMDKDVCYVYTPSERQTQIIIDLPLLAEVTDNPALGGGTVMGAHQALVVMANEMVRSAKAEGRATELLVFVPGPGGEG